MVKDRDDIIDDMLREVVAVAKKEGTITETIARKIADKVRNDWAGSRPYIAQDRESKIAARNEKIYDAYWNGDNKDIKQLAMRYGISVKQVRRIIF
jgi:Mor family transcriptional regulator